MLAVSLTRCARTSLGLTLTFWIGLSATSACAAAWKPPVHTVYWPHSLAGCSLQELQKLAHAGDPAAENALGNRYLHGQDVKQNWKKAAVWYRKAALAGNARARSTSPLPTTSERAYPRIPTKPSTGGSNPQRIATGLPDRGCGTCCAAFAFP